MLYFYAAAEVREGVTRPVGTMVPCVEALTYDQALDRFVLRADPVHSTPIPAEWSQVDEALIEADYPGLLGGE